MLISLNWLKKYVDLPESPRDIAATLTSLGFEVESLSQKGSEAEGVVVGEVLECRPHPNADKLRLCRVNDGVQTVPVVCGAPNVQAGQKVLFARVGASLPGGLQIKKTKIRGEESSGMICAEDELGLGDGHDGILVLAAEAVPGTPLREVPDLCDALFDLSVTPNRPDALCHIGIARELAGRYGRPLRYPEVNLAETGPEEAGGLADVELEDLPGCSRYIGRVIRDTNVGPSPEWLVKALKSVGLKSINNVVDLTNFVLYEFGHPSHAFDLDRLQGKQVTIRRGRAGEKLTTLDHAERVLAEEDLVIADKVGPVCLAGVIGGEGTGVGDSTRNIFLEVAYFNPAVIRRQARRHGVGTDSSFRFERGVDPLNLERISDYLAGLIAAATGGKVARGRIDKSSPQHPRDQRVLYLRRSRVEKVLGLELEGAAIRRLLGGIELISSEAESLGNGGGKDERFAVKIPGFRVDLEREIDLIEEIARLHNLDNIPAVLPTLPLRHVPLPGLETLAMRIRRTLSAAGLRETLSLRFSSEKALAGLILSPDDPRRKVVRLLNPLSEDWSIMSSTLLPSLLNSVAHNQNNQEPNVRFFEVGKAFYDAPDRRSDRHPGVLEEDKLYLVLAGEWNPLPWSGTAEPVGYFHLKGIMEQLFSSLEVPVVYRYRQAENYLHPIESAKIVAAAAEGGAPGPGDPELELGTFGALHPKVALNYGLRVPTAVAEISLSALLKTPRKQPHYRAFSPFSSIAREMNIVVDEGVLHQDILAKIPEHELKNFRDMRLNSVYRGPGIPEGKKALHYSFYYQNPHRTLTDEEVNEVQAKLAEHLSRDPEISFK